MAIKIYSGYDEFKYEENDLCNCIDLEEKSSYQEDEEEEEYEDIFFYSTKNTEFIDSSIFYIVCDLEDEENGEDIAGYLGKFKRIYIPDFHKVLFCVN